MDKLGQVKLLLWKVLNIIRVTLREVLFQGQWKRYSDTFKMSQLKAPLSWFEHPTSKFTTKIYQIY